VLCAVTIPPADLRSFSLYYYVVCGRMCMSSVRVWCSCLLVICLLVHKQMARVTYCLCAVACEGWAVVIAGQWCRKGRWGKK
jgi:hypothetical protein